MANQLRNIHLDFSVYDSDEKKREVALKLGYRTLTHLPHSESFCYILGSGQNQTEQEEIVQKNFIYYHECTYLYNLPNYLERSRDFSDIVLNRAEEFYDIYQKISSSYQDTFFRILLFKASLNPHHIKKLRQGLSAMWLDLPLRNFHRNYGYFCDVGAYDGDTILAFSKAFSLVKAFAVEVNRDFNQSIIANSKLVKQGTKILPFAAWSEKRNLDFKEDHNGMFEIFVSEEGQVPADALDNLIDSKVDALKMDIEGSELQALSGSKRLIIENKPDILIACYHRTDDFIAIPNYIESLLGNSTYEICVGHYSECMDDTIFYFMRKKP